MTLEEKGSLALAICNWPKLDYVTRRTNENPISVQGLFLARPVDQRT